MHRDGCGWLFGDVYCKLVVDKAFGVVTKAGQTPPACNGYDRRKAFSRRFPRAGL